MRSFTCTLSTNSWCTNAKVPWGFHIWELRGTYLWEMGIGTQLVATSHAVRISTVSTFNSWHLPSNGERTMSTRKINALHRVMSSNPVDQVARRVTSQGVRFTPKVNHKGAESPMPFDMFTTEETQWRYRSRPDSNLIGARKGNLRVVGLYRYSAKGKPRWVVKCVCGNYVLKRSSAFRNLENKERRDLDNCCYSCQSARILKCKDKIRLRRAAHDAWWERTGRKEYEAKNGPIRRKE